MLSGRCIDYEGRYFQLRGAIQRPTPVHGSVPVTIAGVGALTMPLVHRHADWWNVPASAADRVAEYVALAGRVRVSVQIPVGLARSSAELAEVRDQTERRFGHWGGLVVGTPDQVTAELAERARLGVGRFHVQLHDFGRAETVRLLGREVLPAVAAAA